MASKEGLTARAIWVAVFVGPPAVVGTVLRHAVAAHRVTAILAALVYAAAFTGLKFAGGVAGDLAARWRARLVERIDTLLQRQVSHFDHEYRDFVLANMRFIDLKGLATVGYFTPELDDVFVDVSLAFRAPHKVPAGLLTNPSDEEIGPEANTERHSLAEFLDRAAPEVLAVVGAPGSGKTTLLRHTARQACLGGRKRRRNVPVLLYLRDHVASIIAGPSVGIADLLRGTLGQMAASEPKGWFEQRLSQGECLILLDGLDEVANVGDRAMVAAWVDSQIRLCPKNDFVITSRPYGYRNSRIEGASVLQVRDFTADQVTQFVRGWYLAVARHEGPATPLGQRTEKAQLAADDLLQRLDALPALHDLTVNPLLLTMIVNVHRDGGSKLPGNRAELYGEICQVVLWRRQEAKRLAVRLGGAKKEAVLRGLAYAMMQRQLRELLRDEVLTQIAPTLERVSARVAPEDFLADIGSNGLLVERESGQYCFAHHTFQEYLAAEHIRDAKLAQVLAEKVDDPWWRETILLFAARGEVGLIVEACLKSSSVSAITLAMDCAANDRHLDTDLRRRLDQIIEHDSGPGADAERRRLIAGVLLAQLMRQQIRTRGGTRICASPVTVALYRKFLEDGPHPGPDDPIDNKAADDVVVGVRAPEAISFVKWANGISGSGAIYRLPASRQLAEIARRQHVGPDQRYSAHRSVWVSSAENLPALWKQKDSVHPYSVSDEAIWNYIKKDFRTSVPTLTRLLLMRAAPAVHRLAKKAADVRDLFDTQTTNTLPGRDGELVALSRYDGLVAALADPAGDFRPNFDSARALNSALFLALANEEEPMYMTEVDVTLARAGYLQRVHVRAERLAKELDAALTTDLERSDPLADALGLDSSHGTGAALSQAFSASISGSPRGSAAQQASVARFTAAFARVAGIEEGSWLVPPDVLPSKLNSAVQAVAAMAPQVREAPGKVMASHAWMTEVTRRLSETAEPVFTGNQRITSATATSVRLAALCLAVEAESITRVIEARGPRDGGLGATFREIAAGTTVIERRAHDRRWITETIMLAID
jgi:NACHT domain